MAVCASEEQTVILAPCASGTTGANTNLDNTAVDRILTEKDLRVNLRKVANRPSVPSFDERDDWQEPSF